MYAKLIPYFSAIFPVPQHLKTLIRNLFTHPNNATVLDIGFGTGNLLEFLLQLHIDVYGLEVSSDLIHHVYGRLKIHLDKLKLGSMEEAGVLFAGVAFDLITCVGNTLVQAEHKHQKQFIQACNLLLRPNGRLIIGLLNYNRILDQKITELPPIERELKSQPIIFHRNYEFNQDGTLTFKTQLLQDGESVHADSTVLYPTRREQVEEWLREEGFVVEVYGGYDKSEWKDSSFYTVFVCRKA
ncbi:hypothetical protein P9112_003566 [Eukaryota sp. TZLM1-RC]